MEHSFEVNLAAEVGVNAAILLKNIAFWCAKHRADHKHFYDGTYWTFSTVASFAELFPYMTNYGIIAALSKLEKCGYIRVGNYNEDRKDSTKWYAATDQAMAVYRMGTKSTNAVSQNDNGVCRNQQPPLSESTKQYPIINTDVRTDKENTVTQAQALFNRFWSAYPLKRKKASALTAWQKLKVNPALFEAIMDGLRRSIQFDSRFKEGFIPHPATWLNAHEWENEYQPEKPSSPPASPAANKAVEELRAIAREVPTLPPRR
ncbi:MAG: hypothetical protein ACOX83_10735 [Candidatus Spyradocola sp.]|jgi:hypothetical protein